jgi:hypothetical protein
MTASIERKDAGMMVLHGLGFLPLLVKLIFEVLTDTYACDEVLQQGPVRWIHGLEG